MIVLEIDIDRLASCVESVQHPFDSSPMFGRNTTRCAGHEQPLETFVTKATYHRSAMEKCNALLYTVSTITLQRVKTPFVVAGVAAESAAPAARMITRASAAKLILSA